MQYFPFAELFKLTESCDLPSIKDIIVPCRDVPLLKQLQTRFIILQQITIHSMEINCSWMLATITIKSTTAKLFLQTWHLWYRVLTDHSNWHWKLPIYEYWLEKEWKNDTCLICALTLFTVILDNVLPMVCSLNFRSHVACKDLNTHVVLFTETR